MATGIAVLREAGWTRDEILAMTVRQFELYLHLATRGEQRRADLIGFNVANHVVTRLF